METLKLFRRFSSVLVLAVTFSVPANAQSDELQQLLLDMEKLTQFKAILSDMKQGYQIYQQGYGTISNLSKGNFNLHNVYLTGLMAVSPAVRNNPRVGQIMGSKMISCWNINTTRTFSGKAAVSARMNWNISPMFSAGWLSKATPI